MKLNLKFPNLKFPNPLNKGEMRAASMNTGDYVDMVQGPWQGVNVLSLVLALSSLIVTVLVVLLYYYKYTSLYYWLAYPALVIVVLVADRLYINHYAPESLLFVECRRKNLPLGGYTGVMGWRRGSRCTRTRRAACSSSGLARFSAST
ncbi:MAG: hypothetical protein QUS33_05965 [Dehalococcoidia bacterium]|nr:hypothetical protein [Dehalococcoidia bacterium]